MKKFNYNIIIFICISLLIIVGLFSKSMVIQLIDAGYTFFVDFDVENLIDNLDRCSKNITYKDELIDLQSLKYRLLGTREVQKGDRTVMRLENDYLCFYQKDVTDALVAKAADACVELKKEAEALNIPFMYIYAPLKAYYDKDAHIKYSKDCDKFLQLLNDSDVHVLDISKKMEEQDLSMEDIYFITDHHWKIETAFWVYSEICKELKNKYDFQYEDNLTSLSNYNVKVYEDWFLGSLGKKVGKYFTPLGVDDFTLITPKFNTNLTVTTNKESRNGDFNNSILYLDNIEKKDYYNSNSYNVYSGGDHPVQIIENNLAPDNAPKILVIRDSFACAVTPFLALNSKSVHCLDIRTSMHGDECENVLSYMKEYNPDYVVILYCSVGVSEDDFSRYDFER